MMKTYKIIGLTALICIIATSTLWYVLGATPTSTFYISSGVYPGASTYTIWREGSNYFAKDAYGELTDNNNFTTLMSGLMSGLGSNGGSFFLKNGIYVGDIVVNKKNVIIEGEGSRFYEPPQWDNTTNRGIYGTVLQPRESRDGILISGANISGLQIRDLGIWFTTANTGNGITTDGGAYLNCECVVIENINVLHHNSSHYAIKLENFLETDVRNINSVGGGMLCLYANWDNFHAGDAVFSNFYGRIIYNLPSDGDSAVGYGVIIARNGTRGNCWVNDLTLDCILMNNPTTQTDGDFYGVVLWYARNMVFNHLHFEGVATTYSHQWINIGECYNLQFNSPYFWSYNEGYVNSQHTNHKITWITPYFGGYNSTLSAGNQTEVYINPTFEGNVSSGTNAGFIGLKGNDGWDNIEAVATSVTVTAKFISSYDSILLTIVDPVSLDAGEFLRVDTITTASNTFKVECGDGATASQTIDFYWQIVHSFDT